MNTYIANERPLDPRLGRWLRVDPELDKFPASSPYAAMDNDPMNKVDEDGDIWNFIAGAAIGAAMDYGMQVAGNLAQGKSLGKAMTEVDGTSILISAGTGALTSGASALGGKVVKVVAQEAIDVGEKVVRKAVDNARQGKSMTMDDLKGVAVDYAKDKVGGAVMGAVVKKVNVPSKPAVTPSAKPTVKPAPVTGKPPLTEQQLVQKIADKANKNVGGGYTAVSGTKKHSYSKDLLERYQSITKQHTDLKAEISYKGGKQVPYGTEGSVRLDVFR